MAISNVNELISDMGIGWNLGNTFECHVASPDRSDLYKLARSTTTAWGTVTTQTWFLDAIKHVGFNTIRIPITWANHIDPITNVIDIEFFEYLNQFVDYTVNTLGMYCIINTHHDDRIWFNTNTIVDDPLLMQKFITIWEQIAEYFKGYDERLIFAGLNEPLDNQGRWDNTDGISLANVNTMSQNFVDTVRGVPGNENRYLCINTYAAKVYSLKSLILPDDKCFADVHIYVGYASEVKSKIDEAVSYNKPFIIGEFGLGKDGFSSVEATAVQSFMITYARLKGASCVLWDDYGAMQFLRRNRITQNNYKSIENFNGYLIDTPKMFIDSNIVKTSELSTSTRDYAVRVNESMEVYPADVKLNKVTFNFSSDKTVADFLEGSGVDILTAIKVGETLISSYSPYGYTSQKLITVVDTEPVRVIDNYTLSLQNIDNWNVILLRTIDVVSGSTYVIKCPDTYQLTLEELNVHDEVLSSTVITDSYELHTSIVTRQLRITIENKLKKDYGTLRENFSSNLIDMSIPYSKYRDEVVSEYAEEGVYVPKLLTRNSKLITDSKPVSSIVYCDTITLNQNSYKILTPDVVIDMSSDVSILPVNTTQVVRFNAVDPSIVRVTVGGVITPLKEGTTDIIVSCGDKTAQFNVLVDYSVSVAKAALNSSIIEQSYVQTLMASNNVDNEDSAELTTLIETSNTLYNSPTILSAEIYAHIEMVKPRLFAYSHKNSLFYKYIASKSKSSVVDNRLTNILFDNTKKLVVTFGLAEFSASSTFITGTLFSVRHEGGSLRVVYGSNGMLFTGKILLESVKLNKLEISKSDVNKVVVLNDEVVATTTNSLAIDTPLNVSLTQSILHLFNLKVYDFATNNLLYDLMPVQEGDDVKLYDIINGVYTDIGTTEAYSLGSLVK